MSLLSLHRYFHTLEKIHHNILSRFPDVKHITPEQLQRKPTSTVLLFDVREQEEYAVSHIAGAKRIPPEMDANTFLREYGAATEGKTLIFYCSVGRRSSAMAQRLTKNSALMATSIFNLQGGIFNWHNLNYSLVDARKPTDAIHPYNPYWGLLLERREHVTSVQP